MMEQQIVSPPTVTITVAGTDADNNSLTYTVVDQPNIHSQC